MAAAGVHIVPLMSAADVIRCAVEAERLGYDYCMIADEGFHPDIYACLGAIARETETIRLGVMTNGYTRHPAVTAAALATVNELSDGRAMVTLLAGGSMVLEPMGIRRLRPYRVMSEMLEVLRRLWSGEPVTWEGETCALNNAQLGFPNQEIPVWIASRGPMLLGLAGRSADGVVLTVKPDLDAALDLVVEASGARGDAPTKVYLGRICYTPEMLEDQRRTLSYVLMDSPPRVLASVGLDEGEAELVAEAARTGRSELVDELVTDDLLHRYQVAGTPAECTAEVAGLVADHGLDAILIDALSSDLETNLRILGDSLPIITGSSR